MFPQRLTDGYSAFLDGRFARERARYEFLAERGQRPDVMLIGCVDSRVSPEVIFDAGPGEMLVVRNVANIVPAYEPSRATQHGVSAAIEFGVQAQKVRHIVVLGHERCGGIRAFASRQAPLSEGDFIGRWMSQIAPAAARLGLHADDGSEAYLGRLERAAIQLSLANLMTFPWVRDPVERGDLELHGAHFGVATGALSILDPATGEFARAVPAPSDQ